MKKSIPKCEKIPVSGHSVNEVYACSDPPLREDKDREGTVKRILIVGAGSYIGTNIEQYLASCGGYQINTLDAVNLSARPEQFKGYDAVLLVAGIAHRKETMRNAHLYYEVNRDLADEIAKAVKQAGVLQFIILSSMSVYGMDTGHITKGTKPAPNSCYGKSKLQADEQIWNLRSDHFRVSILRPPMVYGNGCKGNYQLLRKLALVSPVFPKTDNERSMIYIGNLCSFVKDVIDFRREGIFFPQNTVYVNTASLVRKIAAANGKRVKEVKAFHHLIRMIPLKTVSKVFGSLTYEKTDTIGTFGFEDSVLRTEGRMADSVSWMGTKTPPFSVLMSVYCGEKPEHLSLSLSSILVNQTLKPDEVVLVCDGKLTKNLDDVIQEYVEKFPYILRVLRKGHEGLGRSLNYGLQHCTYDLVARADTDDVCDRKRFEIQVRYMSRHPEIAVCSSYIDEFDSDWKRPNGIKRVPVKNADIRQWAKYRNPVNHMASIYRKKPLVEIGSYRHVEGAEDYDLWVRAMSQGMKLANIPKVLVHARVGNGMVTRRSNRVYVRTWRTIDRYMLRHNMMNKIEYCFSMAGVYIFVYMPEKAKKLVYSRFLRNSSN